MKTVNKLLTISTIPRWEYTCYFVPERQICKCQKQNLFKFIFRFFSFRHLTNHHMLFFRQTKLPFRCSQFFDRLPEFRQSVDPQIRIDLFLMSERIRRRLAVIVAGIDDRLIGQGKQDIPHGAEHDPGVAVAAAADEQRVAREDCRMVTEQPADAADRVSGREQCLDI